MAKTQAKTTEENANALAERMETIAVKPDGSGWERVNPEDGARKYAILEPGIVWQGQLIGRFRRNDRPDAYYYQIRLSSPVQARNKDGEVVTCEKGETLTIDEKTALTSLVEVVERGGKHEVWIHVLEKIPTGGGKSFWRMDVMSRRA